MRHNNKKNLFIYSCCVCVCVCFVYADASMTMRKCALLMVDETFSRATIICSSFCRLTRHGSCNWVISPLHFCILSTIRVIKSLWKVVRVEIAWVRVKRFRFNENWTFWSVNKCNYVNSIELDCILVFTLKIKRSDDISSLWLTLIHIWCRIVFN